MIIDSLKMSGLETIELNKVADKFDKISCSKYFLIVSNSKIFAGLFVRQYQ